MLLAACSSEDGGAGTNGQVAGDGLKQKSADSASRGSGDAVKAEPCICDSAVFYQKINRQLAEAAQQVLNDRRPWNLNDYAAAQARVKAVRRSFDKLSKQYPGRCSLDATDFDEINDKIEQAYQQKLQKKITTFVKGVDFDLIVAKRLKAEAIDHKVESKKISLFYKLCQQIDQANQVIKGDIKAEGQMTKIYNGLVKVLDSRSEYRALALNKDQRYQIKMYADVVYNINHNSNDTRTMEGYDDWMIDNVSPAHREAIHSFLRGRLNY